VGPLQQRNGRILGQFEHPLVEGEPAQLTVEEAIRRQRPVVERSGIGVVVVEQIRGQGGVSERAVRLHRPILPASPLTAGDVQPDASAATGASSSSYTLKR